MPWLLESETSMTVLAGFNSLVSKDGIVTYISGNAETRNGCKERYADGVGDFCEVKSDPRVCSSAFIPLLRGRHDESGWLHSRSLGTNSPITVEDVVWALSAGQAHVWFPRTTQIMKEYGRAAWLA